MSPRSGGEADKLGNHYEGAWIVMHILEVLAGTAESVTVEELGEIGTGAEFTLRRSTVDEVHQVKRQRGSANNWRLGDLNAEGVLKAAESHVAAGRQYHFVSTIPAQELHDLAEQARHSSDIVTFVDSLTSSAQQRFNYLSSTIYGSPQAAWETLRGIWAHCSSERDIRNRNAAFAGVFLAGASGAAAAAALADLVYENLSSTLDKQAIAGRLANYQLELIPPGAPASLHATVSEVHDSWKVNIARELLRPAIPRAESVEITEHLVSDETACVFAVGAGGAGKSAVLYEVVERVESYGWPALALRLDRHEPFSSTAELGNRFGLQSSPTTVLARVARNRPSLLVIDQLDAVSKASGRMPQTFEAVADLVREAAAFSGMRVILACRKFDLDNDDRIRTLVKDRRASEVLITELSDEQVVSAVEALGVDSSRLTRQQKSLLRLPLHLKLLKAIADRADVFSFTSTRDLFNAYWDHKRRDCRVRRGGTVRFAEVIALLADDMSARQRLASPVSILDNTDLLDDADVLASEHVIVRDGQQYAFFHEEFFDYAFARRWTRRGQSLVTFLLSSEQELFRRAQVRQILSYIRDESPERFVQEVESLLVEPRIRYHIKHVALALIRSMDAPTVAEWQMVERLLRRDDLPFTDELWLSLQSPSWFDRLYIEGAFNSWLYDEDEQLQERALRAMLGGATDWPDRLAEVIGPHASSSSRYPVWLRWIARFVQVHKSRTLFELVVDAILRGDYDGRENELFMSVYDLGSHRPEWAVELLAAYLIDRPAALALDERGRVEALKIAEHGAIDLITSAASAAAVNFVKVIVPYMLQVMAVTAYDREDGYRIDRHFMHRGYEPPYRDLSEALAVGALTALQKFVAQQPHDMMPLLDELSHDPHEAAQWLLYEALIAAGPAQAEYAAGVLLDREGGFDAVRYSWDVRRLVQAISPHLTDESFIRLEQAILEYRPGWEGRPPGRASFVLLSAMDETKLSSAGLRRLGELRRLFNEDQPSDPIMPVGGFLGPPIPREAAARMSDEQWLRAMAKHNTDYVEWSILRGGARELSHVLQAEVKNDPGRFCRLVLRVGHDAHPAYAEAILLGLAEAEAPVDSALIFQAVRHIAALGHAAHDRWLGWALRKYVKGQFPVDLIHTLIDRALWTGDSGQEFVPQELAEDDRNRDNLLEEGINTSRGQNAEVLGDLLIYDADGQRTEQVIPVLERLAADPSLPVRACVAHLVGACLRHARPQAIEAFRVLINTDDQILATRHVETLILHIGNSDFEEVEPVIRRMLSSSQSRVRRVGGQMAAYAGLELGASELLAVAQTSDDVSVRVGVARVCARRLPFTADAATAGAVIIGFVDDRDEEVRKAAAEVAGALRSKALRPFERELFKLVASRAFEEAVPYLLLTLGDASDRVDRLILECARRYIEVYGTSAGDMRSRTTVDGRRVGELLMRAYVQASDVRTKAEVLDVLDMLLMSGAYGVAEMVDAEARWA